MARLLFVAPILALSIMPVYYLFLKGPPSLPDLDMNECWGPGKLKEKPDTSIKQNKYNSNRYSYFVLSRFCNPSSELKIRGHWANLSKALAAVRPGLGAPQVAVVMKNLMKRLGYKKFYLQGGDWGSLIGSNMVTLFPDDILGFHTNMAMTMSPLASFIEFVGSLRPSLVVEERLADRMYPLKKRFSNLLEETGYMHIQSSKPDTVGIGLSDSPTGLLAYILEKFSTWTRPEHRQKPDGGLTFRFSKDQLLDNLMFYWAPKSITTSMRLYSETFNSKVMGMKLDEIPTTAPVWVAQAKYEMAYQPPFLLRLKFKNLVGVTVLDDGGHFLAFELPKVFSEDVLKALGEFRKVAKKNVKTDL